ncbi:MAG: AI-2E family transporter [Bacteroidota bacterium]
MESKIYSQFGIKFWIIAASIVIVIAGIREMASLVTPLFLALFITAICYGPFVWLEKKGLPQALSLVIVILGIAVATAIVVTVLGASVSRFIDKLPFYEERFNLYWSSINQWVIDMGWLEKNHGLEDQIRPSSVVSIAGSIFTGLGNLMSDSILILLVVIFMLLEISSFTKKMMLISPSSLRKVDNITHNMNAYFGTKTLTSFITGALVSIALAVIGVDFPILWGFLAFLLNFIPNIGSVIAAVPAVLLALVQLDLGSAIQVAIVFVVINMVIGNIVEPKLMGKSLGLSPLIVFISLIFWGWILGTVGMLLAVPLTMTIKIIFDSMDEMKDIGLMMGDESSIEQYKPKQH